MNELLAGLKQYHDNIFPKQRELFNKLSEGQHPHTLFITCSDSRIDPNLITQTNPGDLFVIRNAGNLVPACGSYGGEEAAIEYAVNALEVKNIVICGHSKCGAMAGLLNKGSLGSLPAVKKWLDHADVTLSRTQSKEDLDLTVRENVLAQMEVLSKHPCVEAKIKENKVNIYGWVYQFETGSVVIYDPQKKDFVATSQL